MEQRRARCDVVLEEEVDEAVVPVEPRLVRLRATVGDDSRPGDREAIRLEPEIRHELHVVGDAVVVVTGDVAGVAASDLALGVRELVPHRTSASVLPNGPLDLVRRGRRPQTKSDGKCSGWSLAHEEATVPLALLAVHERAVHTNSLRAPAADRASTTPANNRCGMWWNRERPANAPSNTAGVTARSKSNESRVKNGPPAAQAPRAR